MSRIITDEGKKALAEMLKQVMEQEGLSSQEAFADWLTLRSGVKFTENRIYRLMKCRYDDAPLSNLVPLIRARILKHPNGELYDYTDLVQLLCGELDPITGERRCTCLADTSNGE